MVDWSNFMIILVIVSVLIAFILQRFLLQFTLKNIHYKSALSKDMIEQDEEFDIVSEVHNDKWLPVMYIELVERLPAKAKKKTDAHSLYKFFMLPRQKIEIRTTISLPSRGRYLLEGGTLHGGDFWGSETAYERKRIWEEVVVIPPKANSLRLDNLLGGFLGDISVHRFIMPDPVLFIGVREYTGREPQKDISWAHSLRARKLMVKHYDHTLELAVTVILNLQTEQSNNEKDIEQCFSITRSVCEELERRKIKYSFITNAQLVGANGRGNDLRDGLGSSHLRAILESLGRAAYLWRDSYNKLMQKAIRRAEQGRYHILINPEPIKATELSSINRLKTITGAEVIMLTPENVSVRMREGEAS